MKRIMSKVLTVLLAIFCVAMFAWTLYADVAGHNWYEHSKYKQEMDSTKESFVMLFSHYVPEEGRQEVSDEDIEMVLGERDHIVAEMKADLQKQGRWATVSINHWKLRGAELSTPDPTVMILK